MVDCRSVWDALKAEEVKTPSESSLVLFLHGLKEALLTRIMRALWWCSTHDMISDGLNKEAISRLPLFHVAATGRWTLRDAALEHVERRHAPINQNVFFAFWKFLTAGVSKSSG